MGGGDGAGLGSISIVMLLILMVSDVGFRIVMYVLGWLQVWNSVRSATIRGEDGIDRWDFVIPPCMRQCRVCALILGVLFLFRVSILGLLCGGWGFGVCVFV